MNVQRNFFFFLGFFFIFLQFLLFFFFWFWFFEIFSRTGSTLTDHAVRGIIFVIFAFITALRWGFVSSAPYWVRFNKLWRDYKHLTLFEVIVARGIVEVAHMKFCVCLFMLLFPLWVFVTTTGLYRSLGFSINVVMGLVGFTTCFCGPWVVPNLCCWPWVSGKSFEICALAWTGLQAAGDGLSARDVSELARENSTIYSSLTGPALIWHKILANNSIEFYDLRSICIHARPDATLNKYIAYLFNGIHPERRSGSITDPLRFPRPESFLDCEENHRNC